MPVKILVADDSATMRKIFEMTFAAENAEVTTVDSGQAAIARARELRPDVVLADLSMQDADAYEVAKSVKSDSGLASLAVIAVASQHTPFDEDRGRQCGVDDHVLKPFDSQALIDKVTQVLGRPRMAAAAAPSPQQPPAAAAAPRVADPAAFKPAPVAAAPGGAPPRPRRGPVGGRTVMGIGGTGAPASQPPPAPPRPRAPAAPLSPAAAPPGSTAAAVGGGNGAALPERLRSIGLDEAQVQAVLALSREVVERVVWEVVPDLAETLIREEIRRLTSD